MDELPPEAIKEPARLPGLLRPLRARVGSGHRALELTDCLVHLLRRAAPELLFKLSRESAPRLRIGPSQRGDGRPFLFPGRSFSAGFFPLDISPEIVYILSIVSRPHLGEQLCPPERGIPHGARGIGPRSPSDERLTSFFVKAQQPVLPGCFSYILSNGRTVKRGENLLAGIRSPFSFASLSTCSTTKRGRLSPSHP